MEIYTTKKISTVDEFGLAPLNTLPCMHVVTPEIIIRVDANENLYIAESTENPDITCIPNLLKIKKLLCKQKYGKECKLIDDIIWVKPSPGMLYKKGDMFVTLNKMVLNKPVKLQLSCKQSYMYSIDKPYNLHNMFWIIDYIIVDDSFDFSA